MARKKTSGVRKKTGSAVPPSKGKKSKASVKKTSPKKRDIRYLPDLQMSDEDTLPSGTDPFEDNGLGSPDCVPIVVKKKSAPVEIITLDNEDTIVTPDSKFLEMTFSEEDPKDDDDRPTPHSSSKQGFDFGRSIQLLSGSSKNQKLVHEPECNETFEMTFSVENIKKEPVDYDSDFDYGNPFSQNLSAKNWTEGKLLSMDEIKKEVPDEDEDDVPLSMLCSLGKKSQVVSEENKICQMMTHPKMDGMAEKMTSDSQGKLSSDCPVMIPNIKTEKIDLSDDPGIVNKTAKPTTKKPNARAKKKSPNVIKDNLALKNLRSNDNTISDVGNSKNQIVDQNVSDNSLSQFQPVNKSNVSGNSLSQFQPVNKSNVSGNSLSQFQPVNKSNVSGNSLSQFQPVNKSNVSGNSLSQFKPVNKSNVSGNSLSQFQPVNKSNVSGNSLSQFQPVNKSNVSGKCDTDVPGLNIKIKQEPLSDSEEGCQKGNTKTIEMPEVRGTVLNKKNDSKSTAASDIMVLSVKIKQEPLSDSEDATKETDSCVSVESQGINKAEAGPDLNPKAVVSSMSSKDNQTHEKEMAISEMVGSPVESRSLVVTSASDEFRKGKNMSANVTNSNSGENTRLPTSSMNELLSKELAPIKNASLNFGTLEKLNPTERVAAEVISSLPAEKLQELIRGIAEARKLDLKPVLEENIAKSETDPAKLKEPVNQESSRQETVESMKIKTEIPESAKHSVVSQPSNAKAEESPKPSSDLHVPDVNLSSSVSPDVIKNVDDKVSAGQAVGKQGLYHDSVTSVSVQDCPSISSSQAANSLPCNSEIKSKDSAIDMNQLMSAENLQNILKTASSLQDSGSIAGSLQDELLRSHQLTNSSVSSDELSNQTQFNDKDQKLISLSTDFLRTVIKTVEASASQGKQSGDESCTSCMTEFSSTGFSELSNKQKHANLETPIVKQEEKSSDTCGNVAKGKDCEKLKVEKSEDEIIDESPDAKRCKTETFEDDYSQVSMECSQPSESENEEHPGSNTRKKRKRKRPRIQKNKKVKKETFHDSCSKQSADEISPEKDIQVLKSEDQNLNSVKNEKVLPPNSLDTSEKSAPKLESNSVRKKLNDSIVEVIKLSGKGQTVPSKGKGSSSRELDHLKPKRKVPSPKRKSADKESALFDVENDPDVVSSKASNKVQRFASRNEFLTKEMLPDDKSVKSSQKQKFKWFKEKKSEPANFQEGHLLVKSPEIDDIHFGDSGNKIEVVVRGGHVNNMSHSLDPRLNRTNSFPAKHAKLNIEEYKEKYRNSTYSGSEFQQIHQMPVSTSNYSTMQQTVFQTNSYWNQSNSANPHPSSVEMTESTLRNPVFSPFQQPVATQSFFPNNSPAVLPSAQPFVPSQGFSLPLQSVISPQNLPSITSNIPVQAVPPTQNLLHITQNPVQAVPPPAQNLPGVTRNVPVQPVRPLQSLPTMTQKVPPVSPLSSTIPPLTFPPPPIRKHLPQQFPSISNVASPPPQPVDAAYSSRFQSTSLRGCFPSPENSLPVQSFAPPLPPQPPPKVDVPPPPPLPPSDFFPPPPPPASPPPDSSPTKSMSLASSSPSLSPPASSPPLQFETSPAKSLSSEFSSTVSKNSISAKFMSSVHGSYSVEQNTRIPSSTPEQLGSCTPSSTPELFFSRPPSSELNDSSTRDSLHFPKVSTQETNSVSIRHSVTSVDSNVQGRTQGNNTKFSSKSSITFKDMTKANSSSKDLLFLILSWSVSWLPQQIQITDPPPITEKVKPVEPSYACYKDYYDTYFPLLLHETWETIFLAWRQAKVIHYFCNVTDHKPEGRLLEMQCNTIISSTTLTEGRYPAEGFLVIIKFGLSNSNGSTKMYGYVSQHSVRPFEIKSDFSNPCLKYLVHQPGEEVSVLSLTIRTAYKCDKIDFSVLPRIQVVHSLKPILKQYDALLNLRVSPLCKGILSADSALCKVISLSKQKNPSTAVVVEEIANLILKPDLAPQIIVIEALPGTDKMNTLVKLIQRLKSAETAKKKTQLLLCSRTNEVVDEVGCHLVLSQEEEDEKKKVLCVRLGRMSDIHPEMRKYSLEDLSAKEVARVKKQQLVKPERELSEAAQKCAKTEIDYKTLLKLSLKLAEKLKKQLVAEQTILSNKQKQKERVLLEHTMYHQRYLNEAQSTIIKTSDVILSTVANCHQTEVDNTCGRNSSMPLDCCIIDDASQCTELETLLPLLYGTSKLVLLGDPNISPRVLSKTASTYKYDLSYYQRVFSQVKIR